MAKKISDLIAKTTLNNTDSFVLSDGVLGSDRRIAAEKLLDALDGASITYVDDKASLLRDEIGEEVSTEKVTIKDSQQGEAVSANGGLRMNRERDVHFSVSHIADDARTQTWDDLKPIFDEKNIKAAVAAPTRKIGFNDRLSVAQLQELQELGWEMMSHTYDDVVLTGLSTEDAEFQLKRSREDLEGWGLKVNNFVPVAGETNPETRKLIRKYYRASFETLGKDSINEEVWSYRIVRVNFNFSNNEGEPLSFYTDIIDKAKQMNAWVVFTYHVGLTELDATSKQLLRDLIDYYRLEGAEDYTPNEALDKFGNIIDVGETVPRLKGDTSGYFKMTRDGRVDGRDIIQKYLGRDFIGENGTTVFDTPADDYPFEKISATIVFDSQVGRPSAETGRGLLVTHNLMGSASGFDSSKLRHQVFYPINSSSTYRRNWIVETLTEGYWSGWINTTSCKYIGENIVGENGTTVHNTPISDYDRNVISVSTVWGSEAFQGFPESHNGTLYTHSFIGTSSTARNALQFQEYVPVGDNTLKYQRNWVEDGVDSHWGDWFNLNTIQILGENWIGPNGTTVFNTPVTDFEKNTINVISVWGSESFQGFPGNKNGTLYTHTFIGSGASGRNALQFQEYHSIDTDDIYKRRWTGTEWTAFARVAGGATGSFTAQSGETINVSNGLTTEITA